MFSYHMKLYQRLRVRIVSRNCDGASWNGGCSSIGAQVLQGSHRAKRITPSLGPMAAQQTLLVQQSGL